MYHRGETVHVRWTIAKATRKNKQAARYKQQVPTENPLFGPCVLSRLPTLRVDGTHTLSGGALIPELHNHLIRV